MNHSKNEQQKEPANSSDKKAGTPQQHSTKESQPQKTSGNSNAAKDPKKVRHSSSKERGGIL